MPGSSVLAIIPPAEVVEAVVRIQQAVGVYDTTWPHVTVKNQTGLEADDWVVAVDAAVGRTPRFDIALTGVEWFGDGIVHLAVDGPVATLHRAIVEAVGGLVTEYEGDDYVPHLTVAADFLGATPEQRRLAADLAACQPWPTFTVEAVTELHRDADDQPYRPVRGFLLSP